MIKYAVLFFIVSLSACTGREATVQPSGMREPSSEELKVAMRYHGIQFAEQDENGEWYFYRDGKRCRLFACGARPGS